jgi:hypothetical protein
MASPVVWDHVAQVRFLPPRPIRLRVGQVDPEGLISLTERGALPRPATNFRIVPANKKHSTCN